MKMFHRHPAEIMFLYAIAYFSQAYPKLWKQVFGHLEMTGSQINGLVRNEWLAESLV